MPVKPTNSQLSFFSSEPEEPAPSVATPAPIYKKGRIYSLDTNDLLADPEQPRRHFDQEALDELSGSIARYGLLQPIIFSQKDDGRLFVVAGGRRLAASRQAGIKNIPSVFTDGKASELSLVENLVRQDLTSIEEAEAINSLKNMHNYTLAELSAILGKSISILSEIISLNRLPDSVRNDCRANPNIARSILVEIAKLPTNEEMEHHYLRYKEKGLSRNTLRNTNAGIAPKSNPGYTRMFKSFSKRLSSIDLGSLAGKNREKARKELNILKDVIEKHLCDLS